MLFPVATNAQNTFIDRAGLHPLMEGTFSSKVVEIEPDAKSFMAAKPSIDISAMTAPGAFFRSVAFPGWGQRYTGNTTRGAIFSFVDISLWTGLFIMDYSAKSAEELYQAYAAEHAGVDPGRTHQFYVDIGNYDNVEGFNRAKRKSRTYEDQYRGSDYYWQWDSAENRQHFEDIRVGADKDKNRVYYFVGGLVLNRLLSGIDAARSAKKLLKNSDETGGISFGVNNQGLGLTWTGSIR
ncbi:hypothetical protein K8I28_00475 [bacterium]|nr:hypothetical protein [bacterium]